MRYPVLLFDVGDTLVGPRGSFGATYSRVLGEIGLNLEPDRLRDSMELVSRELSLGLPPGADRYRQFPGGETEYWLRFSQRTIERTRGEPVDDELALRAVGQLREAFLKPSAWEVFPDVRPTLDGLRAEGVRLGVVSNWDSRLPRVLEMLDLAECFEEVGVSHLEGVEKPDPSLFLRVLRRMGATPDQALHIGDVPELDLAGARQAGIDALLIDRHGRLDPRHQPLSDLSDVPRIAREGLDSGLNPA